MTETQSLSALNNEATEEEDNTPEFETPTQDQGEDQPPEPTSAPETASTRPDGLEDKFWDEEKGEVKFDLLHKNYRELSKKFSQGDHKAPETLEGYVTDLPKEVSDAIFAASDGDASADPLMRTAQETAKELGMSSDMFNKFMTPILAKIGEIDAEYSVDAQAEIAKLGPNGKEVLSHMIHQGEQLLAQGIFSDEEHQAYDMIAGSAAGMRMLQKVAQHLDKGEVRIPTNPKIDSGLPSREELSEMLNSEKYTKDADFRKKVDDMYERMSK